jgi:hypothetical protein
MKGVVVLNKYSIAYYSNTTRLFFLEPIRKLPIRLGITENNELNFAMNLKYYKI